MPSDVAKLKSKKTTVRRKSQRDHVIQTEIFGHPSDLVNDVLIAVTALPDGMFWRANTGVAVTASRNVVRFNLPGTPDVLGVLRGRAAAIECKTGGGHLNTDQIKWRKNWLRGHGIYIVARSVEQALAELQSAAAPIK